jgi:hypothetical protein
MAARIESTTTIARPVDDVFQFLLHLDEHPTDAGVESIARTPDGPVGPGTTLRFNHGNGRETTMRFTSVETNRRIGFEGHVGPLRPSGVFDIAPVAGAAKLTVRVAPNPVGPLKLLSPVVRRIGQQVWDQRLARIKAAIEAPGQ